MYFKRQKMSKKEVKISVVGDGCVGKNSLAEVYVHNNFPGGYVPIALEIYTKEVTIDGEEYIIKISCTAGQEDYEKFRPLSYPETKCFLVCFDINDKFSFDRCVSYWIPEVRHHMPSTPALLIGTKSDMRDEASVSKEEAHKLMRKIKAEKYLECSAKIESGVYEVFEEAVRCIRTHKDKKENSCSIL